MKIGGKCKLHATHVHVENGYPETLSIQQVSILDKVSIQNPLMFFK